LIDDRVIAEALAVDDGTAQSEPQGKKLQTVDLKTAELNYLNELLETYQDREKVAEVAGISMRSLYRKMAQLKAD
jgi:transcriptional regulator with PAS, ATPase and Fis domain